MSKRWQKVEIQYLTKHATAKSLEELAERFHAEPAEVRAKLIELGLLEDAGTQLSADNEKAALEHFDQGVAALYASKVSDAITHLRAASTIGNDAPELAARARQYLAIAEQRHAESLDPDQDPYANAVWQKNRGDYDAALAATKSAAGSDERFAYLAASICAHQGNQAAALEHLGRAIELRPRNRRHAANDPDFETLRADASFSALVRG